MRAAHGRQQARGVQLALDRVELAPAGILAASGRFVPLGNALADDGIRRAAVALLGGRGQGGRLPGRLRPGRGRRLGLRFNLMGGPVFGVEAGRALGQHGPALLRLGRSIGGVCLAAPAVEIFQLGRPDFVPLLQAVGNVGRGRAGRLRVLVSLAQLAGQPAALLVGRQLDKFAAENMVFQVDALGRALGLHVEIFAGLACVAGLGVAMLGHDGPELVEVGHALVKHHGQDALFQFVIRALEIIAFVSGDHRAFVCEL